MHYLINHQLNLSKLYLLLPIQAPVQYSTVQYKIRGRVRVVVLSSRACPIWLRFKLFNSEIHAFLIKDNINYVKLNVLIADINLLQALNLPVAAAAVSFTHWLAQFHISCVAMAITRLYEIANIYTISFTFYGERQLTKKCLAL